MTTTTETTGRTNTDSHEPVSKRLSIHGHEVHYETCGNGPVLLMLHGMASSCRAWRPVSRRLAQNFTIIAPDLLGHGATAKPRTEYSLGAQANMLRDLLAILGHEQVTVVGHSYGGGVAMQFAYQFPGVCRRLVLVGSGGLGQEVSALLRALTLPGAEHLLPLVCSPSLKQAGNRLASWLHGFGLRASPAVEEIWRSYSSLADAEVRTAFFRTLRAVIDQAGQSVGAADRLYLTSKTPTMIVWGSDDAIIPVEHARAARDAMPNSRLHIVEGSGHYPHCEQPEFFVDALEEFIDSTDPADFADHEWRALLAGAPRPASDTQPVATSA